MLLHITPLSFYIRHSVPMELLCQKYGIKSHISALLLHLYRIWLDFTLGYKSAPTLAFEKKKKAQLLSYSATQLLSYSATQLLSYSATQLDILKLLR